MNPIDTNKEPISAMDTPPLLKVTGLKRDFDVSKPLLNRLIERLPRQFLKAVNGVGFSIQPGETFALVGESGCGKSTVANMVVGLYAPTAGVIHFDGTDMANISNRAEELKLRRRMAMIFQDPYASLNPRWRVTRIVSEPIRAFGLLPNKGAILKRTAELLRQVGLTARDGDKFPHEFSGGQRQRISIARALASEPDFIVCDEPTSALDVSVQAQILNLMKALQGQFNLSYLFISHDLAVVHHMAHRVGVMYLGRLCEIAPADDLFHNPRHPYTRLLFDTIPDIEMTGRIRTPVQGEIPNPLEPPAGCSFHPRCQWENDRCRTEQPVLHADRKNRRVACHAVEENRLEN